MPVEVILPRVDMDMTAGKISKWHVADGERVKKGAVIFEIETDKAAMEVEAPGEGVIRTVVGLPDDSIPVGSVVAFIYGEGEAVAAAPVTVKGDTKAKTEELPRPRAADDQRTVIAIAQPSDGIRATPLARKLARDVKIALEGVSGTGPRGRIVAEDVKRMIGAAPTPAKPTAAPDAIASLYPEGGFDLVPHDGMRRTIAHRLVQAKQTIPHIYLTVTCDLDNLRAVRERLNAHAPRNAEKAPAWKISVNDFIIKAMALALQRVPDANATWTESGMLKHRTSDVGVAVAVEGGLFTPVVRRAEMKSLSQISLEMRDLASRARSRKLLPAEYQGGTTAISNLGMFGIEEFAAIINPPQASILAAGAGIARPVAWEGIVTIRTQMTCTLSCDHRVIDGALGAELLAAFRSFIETPELMLA